MNKVIEGICTVVELGCIIGLAAIGLKRNNDCYKAEMKLIDAEIELFKAQVDNIDKGAEIRILKRELETVKSEKES